MNTDLTITLTGKAARDYVNQEGRYNILVNKYEEALQTIEKLSKHKPTAEELNNKYNQTIVYEETEEPAPIIEPNPVEFPATKPKTKSGSHWTEDELKPIKHALKLNHTLASLKVKLSNRSEAAIRTKLIEYGVGVKNNKLYKR